MHPMLLAATFHSADVDSAALAFAPLCRVECIADLAAVWGVAEQSEACEDPRGFATVPLALGSLALVGLPVPF